MGKLHIWVGNFESEALFEKYLDQRQYLEAWAVYDHAPPTGDPQQDAEPDKAGRCEFCKETGMDTYDEDAIIVRYYDNFIDAAVVAEDTNADEAALAKLWKKHKPADVNALIAYGDNELSAKKAAGTKRMQYLGSVEETVAGDAGVHHLWVGEKEMLTEKAAGFKNGQPKKIIKALGLNEQEVAAITFYYSGQKEKPDEMIITQIEDFTIAEKMILKADKMKITAAVNALLDIVVNKCAAIDAAAMSDVLGMKYIGKFE
ncbi:immunity 22 family protein [Chitinophaga oryzae]|uniref:Immunity 22 family protein n=1 Tax=Chitinophaga oryzae TaxID=2725414 RepID=A0ABX6LHB6_9BACT|nr:immunity 22 family protein [Chitinophaga oryzae]QJB39411.1 immunity 22 family protein [Chitinophaga oryzae]